MVSFFIEYLTKSFEYLKEKYPIEYFVFLHVIVAWFSDTHAVT